MSRIRRRVSVPMLLALMALALLPEVVYAGHDGVPLLHSDGLAAPATQDPADYALARSRMDRTEVRAAFPDVDGRVQTLRFLLDAHAERDSMRAFGFSTRELDQLHARCADEPGCDRASLQRELRAYYHAHQLRLRQLPGQRPRLFVDIPAVVNRDSHRVRAAADALRALAREQQRDREWLLRAAVALVQVGLAYRTPEPEELGRQTLGFYTPVKALAQGYGDCDTKSALLAAILRELGDWKLVGVRVPDHYLLGLAREPQPGEAYIEHAGERYVLIEAAGPAHRALGNVAARTRIALARGEEMRIDPLF